MNTLAWHEDHAKFATQLEVGKRWESHAAQRLRECGLSVIETPIYRDDAGQIRSPMLFQEAGGDRQRFVAREFDLRVEGHVVSVKSRTFAFTTPADFPYPTAIINTVAGWRNKADRPCAVLIVSQRTGSILATSSTHARRWVRRTIFDHGRGIEVENIEVPRDLLRPLAAFVAAVRMA